MANGTGNWLDDLRSSAGEMFGEGPSVSYPSTPQSISDQVAAMPNSEKLSKTERWIYEKLPGFSQSSIGKALVSFGETRVGKALGYLDVLAEGLERSFGLIAQYRDMQPGDDFRLKDAWKAGSLFYDTAKLPRLQYDEAGSVIGIRVDSDMPGAYALTEARKKLQDGATIEDVRDELYSNMGALALRAQLNDTLGHVVADPLNWIMAAVKPVERLHALRNLALTGKMDVAAVRILEKEAKLAGNLADAAKFSEAITKAEKTGKALSRLDRFAIAITGGIPYLKKTEKGYELLDVAKMTEKQSWFQKLNPFALTPQARASELLDVVAANVGEYLIRPNWGKDPDEFIKVLASAARGGIGEEWGYLAMTIQGRTVQGILSNSDAAVKSIGQEWKVYEAERRLLDALTNALPGYSQRNIWALAKKTPEVLMRKILAAAEQPGMELLKAEVQSGRVTRELLEKVGKIADDIPLMKEEFYTKALVTIQDVAMQQSIVQFGIKEKGILTKWTDALKAWETLPFIKANPANMIRNVINNDVTLVARGLWGTMSESALQNFWKGKWMPPQMKRAFAFAGEGEFDATKATERIIRTLEGTTETLPQKIKKAAGKIKLGPEVGEGSDAHALLDFSYYSQKMEASASLRASTNGWLEFHNKYWNPKTGFTSITKTLDPAILDEMEQAIPGITKVLDDVAQSAGANAEKFEELMQSSLEHNISSVFQSASENLGYKVEDVLGTEIAQTIREGLPEAMKKGNVREYVEGVKTQIEQHVDDMFNKHVENLPGIIAAQVQAGGPLQFHRVFGKAMDEFWGGNVEHSLRMSTLNELMDYAAQTGDYKKVSQLWEKVFSDGESHFGRIWKKFDAYQEGLKKGAKEAGMKYPDQVASSFKDMRKGWQEVFDFRNGEYRKFFEAKLSGKEYKRALEQIQDEVNALYNKMANEEDRLYQQIDDLMADSLDDFSGGMYRNFRDQASQLRLADRNKTIEFFKNIRKTAKEEQPQLWAKYWQERSVGLEQMRQLEVRGSSAIQGDPKATGLFVGQPQQPEAGSIFELAARYNIPSATKSGARNNRRILSTVNKYLPEGAQKFKTVEEIPMDIAKQAFDMRSASKGEQLAAEARSFIPDAEKIFPDPMPIETALSELNYGRSYAALDNLIETATEQATRKSALLKDLPDNIQSKVQSWMRGVNDEMSGFRAAAVQYSAFRRDSALLNYSRRTNFDTWVGHMAPFAFWTTHSLMNWAVHSIDRPAMLTSYMRSKKLFETAGLSEQNVPKRLKGNIRVDLPFSPDWMGEQFIDPLRILLPFDSWQQPWEQMQQSKFTTEGKAQKVLEQMLEAREITEDEYNDAINNKAGDVWERAFGEAQEGGDSFGAMDFVSMTMTPHAPLMWAYNAATGNKNDIGPFTPMSRTTKNFATMMGVDDWSNSPYNIEGRIRKSMGLPAFDKWDDYRVGREISNIAADGDYDMKVINEAMQVAALVESGKMSSADAVKENELYALATKRANQEYAGGWSGSILSLLGINVKSYPTGEQKQRELAEMFGEAYAEYDSGNVEALSNFFDKYPEYESRLALFKTPDERLKTFMVDNVWTRWNELPKVNQDELKEQLGENFQTHFMNKETRNYDSISPLQLQVWLKLMKGKPVGSLSASDEVMIELNQIKFTEPETAWRVQTFYDMREEFPNWRKLQNDYYKLPENARSSYIKENPELKEYWDSRREWMSQNPDLVRFLTDDPKQLKKYENMQRKAEIATPTADELKANFSQPTIELLNEWFAGETLPDPVQSYLDTVAESYGIDTRTMLGILTGR